jgi:hypothetical protein
MIMEFYFDIVGFTEQMKTYLYFDLMSIWSSLLVHGNMEPKFDKFYKDFLGDCINPKLPCG